MADRIYISSRYSREHVVWITAKLARAGFAPSQACVWDSVGAFADVLEAGDRVVVHSFSTFDGSVELFGGLRLIFRAGATFHSVREADLAAKLTLDQVEALYAASVDGLLGLQAEAFSKVDPSTVERLARMDRLIRAGVSVREAGGRSGCTRNVYYYYKRTKGSELKQCSTSALGCRPSGARRDYGVWPELPL